MKHIIKNKTLLDVIVNTKVGESITLRPGLNEVDLDILIKCEVDTLLAANHITIKSVEENDTSIAEDEVTTKKVKKLIK